MLNKIIDGALHNRLMIVLMLLAIVVGAFIMLPKLNLDAFPDVTNIQVTINTEAEGLASEEVEQLITYPIESVMYALPDVEQVRSVSKTGLSLVTVVFKEGVDIYLARQLVFERLQAAREEIPNGIGAPAMGPNTSGLGQIFQYMLRTDDKQKFNTMELRSLNDWVVKLLLMPIDGVTEVLAFGGNVKQYQVQLDPDKLLSYQLHTQDVVQAIEDSNHNAGGWYLNRGAEQLVIRGVGWVRGGENGLRDIANVAIKDEDGVVVRVSDVASVKYGSEIRQGAVSITLRDEAGKPKQMGEVVTGIIMKRMGANTKSTIDAINKRLPIIQNALPEGVVIEAFYDQASLVDKAVSTVTKALVEAFVLIVVVLIFFLMNLRAATLVLLSVPISIVLALMAMSYWKISANLMSLGGLAIAIGMMVDGSVVMMENIFKHLSNHDEKSNPGGVRLRILEASREVGRPVFFAVLIIIVVFAPLFTLEGVEGKLFQPMAISIVLAMMASLMVALMVVPALSTYLFTKGVEHKSTRALDFIDNSYKKILNIALNTRKNVVLIAVILFIGSLSLLPFLGTEFVPELEEGTINVRVTLAPSSSLETSFEVAQKLERILMEFPEVMYASSRIGRAEIGGDPEPVSNVEIYLGLKPLDEWTSANNRFELQKLMQEKMSLHPGLLFTFSQPIATRVDELLSGVKAQLAIKLFGPDLNVLNEKGKAIEALVRKIDGASSVEMEQISGEAQLVIRPNRDKLSRYGISVAQVMTLVSDAIGGVSAGQVIQGNERYDIYVRFAEKYRNNPATIANLIIQSSSGAWVKLGEVASVSIEAGPPQIRRDDVQRRVVVQSNVSGRDMGSFVAEISQRIKSDLSLPVGYSVVYGGQFENQQRAQAKLMIVVPISLGLIFLLLFFAFGSVSQAALIMLNVPLAMIGGISALFISGQYLSVPGSIGFIALFGVAVLNGVVMVNAINLLVESGSKLNDAVFNGALSRLRPVLMTASIAALGLVPMLLATGVGSEVQRPLATVVVGGLFSSTLLTLFVLPVLYARFSHRMITDNIKK
ncbi:efflux RND transporter permease subunit [bacterium endosymbiont of Bathymodiolus sp. 5 South]|jgi:cobalt-zinc-cadmium resistance protein CzcA|uniref:efflux RND transporter permease subunit n=1 Tax=bacterium endosymbiont of Bathymodiolus sp. 5 South TaxID=1181670 RepID=UPI0010B6F217|nr:CusA/CzcA family heavy metal efflux RND transporter [bacterium endosymbiont of Bathymodiolus sp. 5 South]VVH56154.1 Cobalt-zinc-cadmium resistance protein CzcA; Cation efflux system protein CusA [uncultured Gammaproteobacteria bacterium]SHN91017.1 Cobalt-zinc-cadmium resistance protein CzcA; Cation efflux system protein CusA [bacterium endosymbiont of Bathymodiolus sp. 5 South]SSC07660.1 Cobalt-zinc-cadmium resistance protein CzcA; Cation efflux system protein CusA [bacterium endosymbiont of 